MIKIQFDTRRALSTWSLEHCSHLALHLNTWLQAARWSHNTGRTFGQTCGAKNNAHTLQNSASPPYDGLHRKLYHVLSKRVRENSQQDRTYFPSHCGLRSSSVAVNFGFRWACWMHELKCQYPWPIYLRDRHQLDSLFILRDVGWISRVHCTMVR